MFARKGENLAIILIAYSLTGLLLVLSLNISADQGLPKIGDLRFFGTKPNISVLPYSEGGDSSELPLDGLEPNQLRYVDSESGSNNNDGKTTSTAWQTPGKVTREIASLPPGTHVLFKRGLEYVGRVEIVDAQGTSDARLVLGAYGPLTDSPPRLANVIVNRSHYITIRDLDSLQIRLDDSPSHIIIYNNIVRGDAVQGYPNNGIAVRGGASYVTIVGNTVYDIGSNDGISLHPNSAKKSVGDHHWIVDNLIIGNEGMEEGIDLAMSEPKYGDAYIAGDVKVVGNKVSMRALAGRSTLSGYGQKAFEANHAGYGLWVVGNIFAGPSDSCIRVGLEKKNVVFAGNIIFSCNQLNSSSPKPSAFFAGTNINVSDNTFLHSAEAREVVNLAGASVSFLQNHIISNRSGSTLFARLNFQSLSGIKEMDRNVYSFLDASTGKLSFEHIYDGARIAASFSLAEFIGVTDFESNGLSEVVAVKQEPLLDPYSWGEQFLKTMADRYAAKSCSLNAGAINCNGDLRGLHLSSLPDIGAGWAGPAIVRERLRRLGVSY